PLCIVTVALRGLPFAALRSFRESKLVAWLGMGMPVGVMSILVIYTAADRMDAPGGLASLLIAVAFTTIWHLWRRSATQSILRGMVFFVLLVSVVFGGTPSCPSPAPRSSRSPVPARHSKNAAPAQ